MAMYPARRWGWGWLAIATVGGMACDDGGGTHGADAGARADSGAGALNVAPAAGALAGVAPFEVELAVTVSGATGELDYRWSLPDGTASTDATPAHTFDTPGQFVARVDVTDADGRRGAADVPVLVLPAAAVLARAEPASGPAPLPVTFECAHAGWPGPLRFDWSFGDGGGAVGPRASHRYARAGRYEATCVVRHPSGLEASAVVAVAVEPTAPLLVRATATPEQGVATLEVAFDAVTVGGTGEVAWQWRFGDDPGAAPVDGQRPTHTYTTPGAYIATVTVTDAAGGAASDAIRVRVGEDLRPTVRAEAAPAGPAPLTVRFSALPAGGDAPLVVTWDFGDASAGGAGAEVEHVYAEPGDYTATVEVRDADGDLAMAEVAVRVLADERPDAEAAAEPAAGLAPLRVAFTCNSAAGDAPLAHTWDFGDGQGSDAASPVHIYAAAGRYTATCTVTDADGDRVEAEVTVDVAADRRPLAVAIADPTTGPAPLAVQLDAIVEDGNGASTINWTFGDGEGVEGEPAPVHVYERPGAYTAVLRVIDEDGDAAVAAVPILVVPADEPPAVVAAVSEGACAVPGVTEVLVDAGESRDPEGALLTYEWVIERAPPRSRAQLAQTRAVQALFVPDVDGEYRLRVFVSDGGHRVASPELVVTADTTADTVEVEAGADQRGAVLAAAGEAAGIVARNRCGAPTPDRPVTWTDDNARVLEASDATDAAGRATATVRFGRIAGPGRLFVRVDDGEAEVALDAEPGPARYVMLQPVAPVVSDTVGATLVFRVTDAQLNPRRDVEASFVVEVVGAEGGLGNPGPAFGALDGAPTVEVTTTNGEAAVELFDTNAEAVFLSIRDIAAGEAALDGVAWAPVVEDDFDGGRPWRLTSTAALLFGIGAPDGPGAAWSGEGALGAGPVEGGAPVTARAVALHPAPVGLPGAGLQRVAFHHWYDFVDPTAGCALGVGRVRIGEALVEPDAGHVATTTCVPLPDAAGGFGGSARQWTRVELFAEAAEPSGLAFEAVLAGPPGSRAAGWFVDDVSWSVLTSGARVDFAAGPPAGAVSETVAGAIAGDAGCAAPGLTRHFAVDAFGNPIRRRGVELEVDVAGGLLGALRGGRWLAGGPGETSARIATGDDGEVRLEIPPPEAGEVEVSARPAGLEVEPSVTRVAVVPPPAGEGGACADGRDDDCDGAVDCVDADCAATDDACVGEVCEHALPLGVIPEQFEHTFDDLCGRVADAVVDASCGGGEGAPDVVATFTVAVRGDYRVEVDGGGVAAITTGPCPGDDAVCASAAPAETLVRLFDGTEYRVAVQGAAPCQALTLRFTLEAELVLESPEGANCVDGVDNDADGLTDCEQPACQGGQDSPCSADPLRIGADCSGEVPGGSLPVPFAFGCRCVNAAGCDDLDISAPGLPFPLGRAVCHTGLGVCGIDCQVFLRFETDLCSQILAGTCQPDGTCAR